MIYHKLAAAEVVCLHHCKKIKSILSFNYNYGSVAGTVVYFGIGD